MLLEYIQKFVKNDNFFEIMKKNVAKKKEKCENDGVQKLVKKSQKK